MILSEKDSGGIELKNPDYERDISADDIIILVMGDAGTGKSTFVKAVTGMDIPIGSNPKSKSPINLFLHSLGGGRRMILVDTPGFGDTKRWDADTLAYLSSWLAATYAKGIIPRGTLFFHPVTDDRIGDTTNKRLKLYRRLWGEQCLQNLIIVTTMWDTLTDATLGEARIRNLESDPLFWAPFPLAGTRVMKFVDRQSAVDILALLENNDPIPLRIQTQLVDEHQDLVDTAAGRIVEGDLKAMRLVYEELMKKQHGHWFRPVDSLDLEAEGSDKDASRAKAHALSLWARIRAFIFRESR